MFAVIFEVWPKPERFQAYLDHAAKLRPELLRVNGFVENLRYRSLHRPGWLLSLSIWRDEKALVRWRTHALHHAVQVQGRTVVFQDYHLRVGQVTADTHLPPGQALREQRLDETEAGAATCATLVTAPQPAEPSAPGAADGLVAWDAFAAIQDPGERLLLLSWRDAAAAETGEGRAAFPEGARIRRVRVVRDYGLFDRREAPQFYPEVVPASA